MTLTIYEDIEQGTPQWLKLRSGIPTASNFAAVIAKGEGKTRATYMRRLAGEIITGEPAETFKSPEMERGNLMEEEARNLFAFKTGYDLRQVAFIRNGRVGCSPDSLVGNDGMLEIKTKKAEVLIEALLRDDYPPEHKAQVQGQLWVAERDWCDLFCYWPGMPPAKFRIGRDELFIRQLSQAVDAFNSDLDDLVAKVRSFGVAA